MQKEKLVMIGNGMAGMRFIDELLKRDPDSFDIHIIGGEPRSSYNRIQLSPVLAGEKTFSDIVTHDDEWHQANDITLTKGVFVTYINRDDKTIRLANGNQVSYDKLVIATGAKPFLLDVPGADLENVLSFRDHDDVKTMMQLPEGSHAVVIGGGLLGLEAAYGLVKRGAKVTVFQRANSLMNRQLDPYAANMLREVLEAKGINFLCGVDSDYFIGDAGKVVAVKLKDGREIACDMVIKAIGIKPNIVLGKMAGLQVRKGILVDAYMRTADEHIFALGECSEFNNRTFGLVAPLFEQATSLAAYLSKKEGKPFEISPTATRLKVTGVELFSAGQFVEDDLCDVLVYRDPSIAVYKKLVLKNNRIIGMVLYGDTRDGSWFFDLMLHHQNISSIRSTLIFGQAYHPAMELPQKVA